MADNREELPSGWPQISDYKNHPHAHIALFMIENLINIRKFCDDMAKTKWQLKELFNEFRMDYPVPESVHRSIDLLEIMGAITEMAEPLEGMFSFITRNSGKYIVVNVLMNGRPDDFNDADLVAVERGLTVLDCIFEEKILEYCFDNKLEPPPPEQLQGTICKEAVFEQLIQQRQVDPPPAQRGDDGGFRPGQSRPATSQEPVRRPMTSNGWNSQQRQMDRSPPRRQQPHRNNDSGNFRPWTSQENRQNDSGARQRSMDRSPPRRNNDSGYFRSWTSQENRQDGYGFSQSRNPNDQYWWQQRNDEAPSRQSHRDRSPQPRNDSPERHDNRFAPSRQSHYDRSPPRRNESRNFSRNDQNYNSNSQQNFHPGHSNRNGPQRRFASPDRSSNFGGRQSQMSVSSRRNSPPRQSQQRDRRDDFSRPNRNEQRQQFVDNREQFERQESSRPQLSANRPVASSNADGQPIMDKLLPAPNKSLMNNRFIGPSNPSRQPKPASSEIGRSAQLLHTLKKAQEAAAFLEKKLEKEAVPTPEVIVAQPANLEKMVEQSEPENKEEPVVVEEPITQVDPEKVDEPEKAEDPIMGEETKTENESKMAKVPVTVEEPKLQDEPEKAEEPPKEAEIKNVDEADMTENPILDEDLKTESVPKSEEPIKEEPVKEDEPKPEEEAMEDTSSPADDSLLDLLLASVESDTPQPDVNGSLPDSQILGNVEEKTPEGPVVATDGSPAEETDGSPAPSLPSLTNELAEPPTSPEIDIISEIVQKVALKQQNQAQNQSPNAKNVWKSMRPEEDQPDLPVPTPPDSDKLKEVEAPQVAPQEAPQQKQDDNFMIPIVQNLLLNNLPIDTCLECRGHMHWHNELECFQCPFCYWKRKL